MRVDEAPVSKNRTVLEAIRGMKAFLNPKARVAGDGIPEPGARSAASRGPGVLERTTALARKLKRAWLRAARVRSQPSGEGTGGMRAENVVWVFGSGRTGSTWLSYMMEEMEGQTVWREPLVGEMFGSLYYIRAAHLIDRPSEHFILGGAFKKTWFGPMRDLVLGGAAARFPEVVDNGYLVIKEPNGSIGAPLLMEALPESRMVLLIRDPRDVVASSMDARRGGGWLHESKGDRKRTSPVDEDPNAYVRARARSFLQYVGNAREAYEAHEGYKALLRYEDLLADTLGSMRRMYAQLGMEVDGERLARAVEKHAWGNVPEEKKGAGKFYRKATPGAWREDLTPRQARIVERITAPLLREYYPA